MEEEFSSDVSQDTGGDFSSSPASNEPQQAQDSYEAPPRSWSRDISERHWRALPSDLRGYLHERETSAHSRISEMGNTLSQLQQEAARMAQEPAPDPYQQIFERYQDCVPQGVDRATAIEHLLAATSMLERPETREAAVGQLLQQYGIDPSAPYREQLNSVRRAEVQRTLDEFVKDKSYYGEIRSDVIKEIVELRKMAPGLDNLTVLKLAHDRVVDRTGIKSRLDIEAKAKEAGERQKQEGERQKAQREENDRRVKAAKRAAGINVKSSPAQATAPKSLDQELWAIARKRYGT